MANKPTYEELELRNKELEQAKIQYKLAEEALRKNEKEYRTTLNCFLVWTIQASVLTQRLSIIFLKPFHRQTVPQPGNRAEQALVWPSADGF